MSRDTVFGELSTSVSLNRYTYAYNNPLSMWDPDGRCPDYLKSVNGGAAWEQCRSFQDEMGRKGTLMLAQKKVQERVNSWFGKTNESPEPASAEAQEAPGTPGHLMYNPMCDCTTWVPDRSFSDHMKGLVTAPANIGLAFLDDWVLKPAEITIQGGVGLTQWGISGEWHGFPDYDLTVGPVDFFGTEHTKGVAERSYEAGGVLSTVTSVVVGAKAAWKGAKWVTNAIKSRKAVPTGLVDDAARLTNQADDVVAAGSPGTSRFVANGAGEILDTSRITIPNGKYAYLLENPSKSGVFVDSMGFDQASLSSALRSHLVDNFGRATSSVPMVGGGTKFTVTGPMVGPSGAKWTITTVWGVDLDGTIRLITATP